jgi:hypothetical protein
MKPFVQKSYFEPNTMEKLFKKVPKNNFLIELNNLLAQEDLENLSRRKIVSIEGKYGIDDSNKIFHNELCEMFKEFLNNNLGNDNENNLQTARNVKDLLGLSNSDFEKIYEPISLDLFEKEMNQLIHKNLRYSEEEQKIFNNLIESFGISEEKGKEILNKIKKEIVTNFYQKILEDKRVSPDEEKQAAKLCLDLDVTPKIDENSQKIFDNYKRLWAIENSELVRIEPDIIVTKNEYCYMQCSASLFENRRITKRVGYSGQTFRFKIAKGWYYRTGDFAVKRTSEDILIKIDDGVLHITNKKILFVGSKQNKTIRFNQIVDIVPFSDGFELSKETGKSPFFTISGEFPKIAVAIIARVIKDSQE